MAVDWLRSCYSSRWYLFKDAPLLSTAGRYYFSPPRAPFFPARHNLGSRNWNDKNWECVQALGEDLVAARDWNPGDPPAVNVSTSPIGSNECLADGEAIADAVQSDDLVDGFVPACILPTSPNSLTFDEASAYNSCSIQLAHSKVIDWMYGANAVSIVGFLNDFLGAAFTVQWHNSTLALPSVTTAISAGCTLVWVDGTVNFQQFAFQAAYSFLHPTNFGILRTSDFWYDASNWILAKLVAAGYDPTKPVFLCGHSYGAVAALILAARFKVGIPDREVKFLTFGCPHIGDNSFVLILRACAGLNLRNDTDIVTAIPPDLDWLWPVYAFLLVPDLLVWPSWKKAPFGSMMDAAGALTPDAEPILDYPTLLAFAQDAIAALPYPSVEGHRITTYYSRILARCGAAEWPLTPAEFVLITGTDFIITEDDFAILQEGSGKLLAE
jgi:pimeloyl-ACP methyl ester carboxylesterase